MKRVTLKYRKYVNWLEQEGRVVLGYHPVALDDRGTPVTEVIECAEVSISEFCVQMRFALGTTETRAIPLDLLYDVTVEEA